MVVMSKGGPPLLTTPSTNTRIYTTRSIEHELCINLNKYYNNIKVKYLLTFTNET